MRIHKVTMTGFGPYKGTEFVDFDDFEADGLFLISGKTGAGKTSILDAVTFALYGSIPRYDGAAGEKVRSDHIGRTELCEVALEFTAGDVRYRVTRSPEYQRPKQRGDGFMTEAARAEIARWAGNDWEVLDSQVRNVALRIEEVVHLTASQFQQVILLAQGRFQEFLIADSDKRRELLRTLFGTKRFSDYADVLDVRAKALRAQLARVASETSADVASLAGETGRVIPVSLDVESGAGVVEWANRLVIDQQAAVAEAEAEEKLYKSLLDTAAELHERARSLADRQSRRADALERQAKLAAEAELIAEDGVRLDGANRAELAWPVVKQHADAEAAQQQALGARRVAQDGFRTVRPGAPEELTELDRAVVELTEATGSLRDQRVTEQSLPGLRTKVERSANALLEHDAQSDTWIARREELRQSISSLEEEVLTLSEDAGLLPAARAALDGLSGRLASAMKAEKTAAELAKAKLVDFESGSEVTERSRARDALRARQLDGYAAVLAEQLVDFNACPVCGSLSHPAPATHGDGHVTDEQMEQAEAAYGAAVEASQAIGKKISALVERLDQEQENAGREDVAALTAQVDTATSEIDRLSKAVQDLEALEHQQRAAAEQLDACAATIESCQQERMALVGAQAAASRELERAVAAVDQAKGDYASVAARLAEVDSQLHVTKCLQQAVADAETASRLLAAAADNLHGVLAEQAFDSADAVRAARVAGDERKALKARVDQHAADIMAAEAILAADDMRDLPDDPVDVAGLAATLGKAGEDHTAAVARRSGAEQKASTLVRLTEGIAARMSAAADVREQYQLVNRLASTMKGQSPNTRKMSLESFVLAAELEEIVKAANGRLRVMTSGRYEFQYSDAIAKHGAQSGLSLDVLDAHTGEARPPQSLSGGEKFQASLALALGLAEVVSSRNGGIKLDTLFVDEGFGSLSDDTLETTMATLDSLREGGRTVGLISHVQSMKETIPSQLKVRVTDGGWSTIER